MDPDYDALKVEIAKADYGGKTDAEIVALLNAAGTPAPTPYPAVWLCQIMSTLKVAHVIEDEAANVDSPVRDACIALQWFAWGIGAGREVDVNDANFLADLESLVTNGKMAAEQKTAIVYANAKAGPSIANGLGFPSVTTDDLTAARSR